MVSRPCADLNDFGGLNSRLREELLRARETILEEIALLVRQSGSRLRGRERIAHRIGREANRRKVEKHVDITVTDDDLS